MGKEERQYVCLTNFIWNSTSNPKCHVAFSKRKIYVNWHPHFFFKYHLNVTCSVVRVISILKCRSKCGFFLTSHTTCQNLKCACQLTCNLFLCKVLRVKNLQKLCHKYTHRKGNPCIYAHRPLHSLKKPSKHDTWDENYCFVDDHIWSLGHDQVYMNGIDSSSNEKS